VGNGVTMARYGRRLTSAEARELRIIRVTTRAKVADLAKLYNVSQTTVLSVIRGLSYLDAGGPADDVILHKDVRREHGTAACYATGCRLPACVQANKDRSREYRQRKKKERQQEGTDRS